MTKAILTLVILLFFYAGTSSQNVPNIPTKGKVSPIEGKLNLKPKIDSVKLEELVKEIILIDTLKSIADKKIEVGSQIFEKRYNSILQANKEKDSKIHQLQKESENKLKETQLLLTENLKLKDSIQLLNSKVEFTLIDSLCTKRKGFLNLGRCIEWTYTYKEVKRN